jgi:polyphosphate glucokinase
MAPGRKTGSRTRRKAPRVTASPPAVGAPPTKILAIDVGGSKIKILASGETEPRKAPSGKGMTPSRMVEAVRDLAKGWDYEAVSIGLPALVGMHGPHSEPGNLGPGWVGFNFAAAFELPVRIINDAAMQALGSYEGGRMLFLGLGTGLGSTLIAENVIVPLELGQLRYKEGQTLGDVLGRRGMERLGKAEWRDVLKDVVATLAGAFQAQYVVLGGGNAKTLKELPPGIRLGHNLTAFRGGFRLWSVEDVPTLAADGAQPHTPRAPTDWRVI